MKVLLYTAPACPFCVIVKKYLERNNVKFTEVDISKDAMKKKEMEKKSNQSNVPVVDVNLPSEGMRYIKNKNKMTF